MSSIALTGLASGVDTASIVEKLMAVDRQATTRISLKQARVQGEQLGLQAIQSKLTAFQTAATALKDSSTWAQTQAVASSDPNVGVTKLSGAGVGGHTVAVARLASSAQHGYGFTSDATNPQTLTFAYANDPTSSVTINLAAGASVDDVVTAVNAASTAPVYAAKVTDPTTHAERLVFSARKTGAGSDFTVASSGGQVAEDSAYSRTGTTLNADVTVDGAALSGIESNVVDHAVPGLRLTLKGVTAQTATVTVAPAAVDSSAISTKVKALVDAYNGVVDTTRARLSEKRVANATTADDAALGALFGDTGMDSMLSSLRAQLQSSISGLGSLADVGITVPAAGTSSADAKAGKLTFDSTKLQTALDTDWTKVRDLFAGRGATAGFGYTIERLVSAQTGTNGLITQRLSGDTAQLSDLTSQMTDLNSRLNQREARLKAQFAAMESALQSAQTQQSWLSGQLSSLSSS